MCICMYVCVCEVLLKVKNDCDYYALAGFVGSKEAVVDIRCQCLSRFFLI